MIVTKGTFTKAMGAGIVALLVIPGATAAQQHGRGMGTQDSTGARSHCPAGGMMMQMPGHALMQRVMRFQPDRILSYSDALKLTTEQLSQLEALDAEQEAAHREHMSAMGVELQKLEEIFDADSTDREEVRKAAERVLKPHRAFFGILLSPIIAAAAMSFSSVSVVSNALRLRRVRV